MNEVDIEILINRKSDFELIKQASMDATNRKNNEID